jgi:hypothetical protein
MIENDDLPEEEIAGALDDLSPIQQPDLIQGDKIGK